jgi:hypothetical protein
MYSKFLRTRKSLYALAVFADEKIDGKEGFALSKGRKRKGEVNRRR